jgi:hypothetical protein
MSTRKTRRRKAEPAGEPMAPPELVILARADAGLRATAAGVAADAASVTSLKKVLSGAGATIEPIFGSPERAQIQAEEANLDPAATIAPGLAVYHRVAGPEDGLEDLAARLLEDDVVEAAYVKPPAEPAQLNDMTAAAAEAPPVTADFTARQLYLDPAPGGIDARYAWTLAGGRGAGVRIVDIEGAWRFSHEDLLQNQGGVIGGVQSADIRWRNHGTAVVGEFGGDVNAFGVTGICPDANVRAVSIFTAGGASSSAALVTAANALSAGDIILIELHRPGPGASGVGQDGFIAIEWWPDDFDAILYATSRGVVVVEAAGNGFRNLDDPIYNTPGTGFPSSWTNPFNRANRDSGAVVVGAGAPPPGTHNRNHGPDRSRLDFSNWGALVDAQGWGREVTTCGYGDLQGGASEDLWYTDQFSGTSSASPIVVGALGCVQGVLRARGAAPLTPAQARQRLRATGSPQQDGPGAPATQRIGNRPDLRQLVPPVKKREKEKLEKIEKPEKLEKIEKREKLEKLEKSEKREKVEGKDLIKREKLEKREKPERKEWLDGPGAPAAGGVAEEGLLEDRLARLEETVDQIFHFIGGELRPDLGEGALGHEEDLGDLSGRLDKDAADAKQAKDGKDVARER